jgi:hypothetical protein
LAEIWLWHPQSGVHLFRGRFPVVASKARDAPATSWQLFELLFCWRYQNAPRLPCFNGRHLLQARFEAHLGVMNTPTLAEKLGTTTQLSGLLIKAKRLGLNAEGLERLAIQRGCNYYHEGEPLPPASVSEEQFSNEELALALLNPALRYHPQTLRLGAAMLGAEGNDPEEIARLTKYERGESIVRYVAEAGRRFEPENRFWERLLALLPQTPAPDSAVVPHPTRFVQMTGIDRGKVGLFTRWVRPLRRIAA